MCANARVYVGAGVQLHSFLTSGPDGETRKIFEESSCRVVKILLYPVLGRTEENYENMSQVDGLVRISTGCLSNMIRIIYHCFLALYLDIQCPPSSCQSVPSWTIKQVQMSLYRSLGLQEVEATRASRHLSHEGGKVFNPTYPPGDNSGILSFQLLRRSQCDRKDYVNEISQ